MSALTRMAMATHKKVGIRPGDTIIISASPIPGNEKDIGRTINHLFRQGADVIYDSSLVCMLQDMQVKKSLSS